MGLKTNGACIIYMSAIEIWKPIDGYKNYQVSSFGNVRNTNTGRILKSSKRGGYCSVGMSKQSITKTWSVHQLVAKAFIPNPENKSQINHMDKNGFNNHVTNLEWNTNKENSIHRSNGVIQTTNQQVAIYKLNKDTNEILDRYDSIELASNSIIANNPLSVRSGISIAIKNNTTSYGYRWKKVEQPEFENEEWREIHMEDKETNGYFISSLGRFKNKKGIIMKDYKPHHSGYVYVRVNIQKYALHRLVAHAFIPNTENKPFVNHIDGIKTNNALANLEWVTCAENNQHNHTTGLIKCFTRKVGQYDLEMNEINRFDSIVNAAKHLGISAPIIKAVLYKKQLTGGGFIWKYLDE